MPAAESYRPPGAAGAESSNLGLLLAKPYQLFARAVGGLAKLDARTG